MMTPLQLQNKRVLVVGLGATGNSVVRYLHTHKIAFDVVDERARPSAQLHDCLLGIDVHEVLDASLCCQYDVLVLSPGVPRSHTAIKAAMEQGVVVIGDVELFVHAIGDTPVIAVTGSNGKSTVVSWVAHVLQACGRRAVLCGNIGLPALESIDNAAEVYVLELSSYQLESTHSLSAFAASVLNISDDHMDRYESIEHYAAVKRRIYSHCRNVVVNHDDKATWPEADADASSLEAVAEHASANRLAFSLDDSADVDYRLQSAANDSWLCHRSERVVACNQLQVPGNHNIANALAVLALLEPFALDQNALAAAITGFTGLEHRTEFVRELNGVRWYNDSKGTNIDACEKAIEAMQAPVVLIAGGLGKGADFTSLSDVVKEHVKLLVLIGEDAALIADALANTSKIEMAVSLAEAVSLCADFADAGDAVLLSPACASFDMFENFEQRGVAFKRAVEALAA